MGGKLSFSFSFAQSHRRHSRMTIIGQSCASACAFVDNHWTVMRECLCLVIALLYRVPARCPAV